MLIADPKQAVYAFRGADVYAYLEAASEAAGQATLDVNWRSDQGLIDAYDALLSGAKLGHEGIVYRRVRAADAHRDSRLHGAPSQAPLRFRVVPRELVTQTFNGFAQVNSAREHVATDLAEDVVELLSSGAEIEERWGAGDGELRELRPGDVAVLVQTNRTAAQIREALERAGVPAVINGAGSVFATEIATEWLRLLEALERPASTVRAHTAALTCFIGWSAERVAESDEQAWEDVHRRLHDWARVLRERGVASLTETVTLTERLPRRLLADVDGERRLTDLRHVGQLLHAAASSEQLGVTALTAWLRRRITEAYDDTGDEERSRRLESDEQAVQVLTIHRSKGLEFPVVYLPFLWDSVYIRPGEPVFFHDPGAGDLRTIDVATDGPQYREHELQHIGERRGEDLRLAYVGLTRARHQTVVWWAGSKDAANSPLGRLLFSRDHEGNVAAYGKRTPSDTTVIERFQELAEESGGQIDVERSKLGRPGEWISSRAEPRRLGHAEFDRRLDWSWRRTSYTDITAGAYEAAVATEPDETLVGDEPDAESPAAACVETAPPGVAPSLLAEMPAGAEIGTLVHRVLAATDFAAADLDGALAEQIDAAQSWRAVDLGERAGVVAGLRAAIETPLGPMLGGVRLRDIARPDRVDELEFELPLAGGDEPTGALTPRLIADVLREHLTDDDPLTGYADRLTDEALRQSVHGYLTGSLDLVLRLRGRRRRAALRRRRLQDQLARRPRRGACPVASPARRARRRDAPPALRAAGVAVHGRAAPLSALAAPGLRPGPRYRGRPVPVPPRDGRARHADGGPNSIRRVRVAAERCARRGPERRARPGSCGGMSVATGSIELDPFDARRVRGAGGLLREFNAAGVLSAADVHVASRLAALAGEHDESLLLAVALAVRAPRLAHVQVDLATIRDTAAVDADEPVDLSSLPWPDPSGWIGGRGRERPRRGRGIRRGRVPAAAARHRAVSRPLLGRRSDSWRSTCVR